MTLGKPFNLVEMLVPGLALWIATPHPAATGELQGWEGAGKARGSLAPSPYLPPFLSPHCFRLSLQCGCGHLTLKNFFKVHHRTWNKFQYVLQQPREQTSFLALEALPMSSLVMEHSEPGPLTCLGVYYSLICCISV